MTGRLMVSYKAGEERTAFVEPIAAGEPLRDMPLFPGRRIHVMVPLTTTYQTI